MCGVPLIHRACFRRMRVVIPIAENTSQYIRRCFTLGAESCVCRRSTLRWLHQSCAMRMSRAVHAACRTCIIESREHRDIMCQDSIFLDTSRTKGAENTYILPYLSQSSYICKKKKAMYCRVLTSLVLRESYDATRALPELTQHRSSCAARFK